VAADDRYRRASVLLELTTTSALLTQLFVRELEALGLRPAAGGVLALVAIHGPLTPTDLERESGLAGATLRDQVAALIDRGYVERVANPDDARSHYLDCTDAGLAWLEQQVPAMRAVEDALEQVLGHPLEDYRAPVEQLRRAVQLLLQEHAPQTGSSG
jgi:DNA-binding MarR family transcriptional regulator